MGTPDAAIASFERNIHTQTGRAVADWVAAAQAQAQAQGAMKHGQVVAWLKAEHGLSHAHANHIAKRAAEVAAPRSTDDPVAHLFDGKAALRPLYDRLVERITTFGADVAFAPKKANVSVRRRRQFALLQPSTATRLDMGLILQCAAVGRLEAAGSFNAMFTHRLKLAALGDIDDQVIGWLREAYDAAQ
jgi:hypothetical protein